MNRETGDPELVRLRGGRQRAGLVRRRLENRRDSGRSDGSNRHRWHRLGPRLPPGAARFRHLGLDQPIVTRQTPGPSIDSWGLHSPVHRRRVRARVDTLG